MTRREGFSKRLEKISFSDDCNAGLWFDKFIFNSTKEAKSEAAQYDKSKKDETAKTELIRRVTSINEPDIYNNYFYKVWQPNLYKFGAKCREAKVKNRLAINLGSESVLETSIALHRVFGVPFIPGSALKGLVSHFLHQYGGNDWKKGSDNHTVVFGNQDNAGFVTFYDALYIPESGFNKKPLYADVMTTHHQDYYGNNNVPPADWDSPNPVPFISATGKYLTALSGPSDWVNLTFDILGFALEIEGIGAKTSSGYGRMWLADESGNFGDKYKIQIANQTNIVNENSPNTAQSQPFSDSERIAKSLIQRINALRNNDVASQIPNFAKECLALEDESAKKQVAVAIKQKIIDVKRENASKGKKWYEDIIPFTEDAEWIVTTKNKL